MPGGSFNLVYTSGVERESGVQAPLGRGSLKLSIKDAHLVHPGSKHHGTRQSRGPHGVFHSPRTALLYSSNLTRTSMTLNIFQRPPTRGRMMDSLAWFVSLVGLLSLLIGVLLHKWFTDR